MIKVCWWFFYVNIKYGICLILFFSLYELFSDFVGAINTGHFFNNLFKVSILIPVPSFPSSLSLYRGNMGGISPDFMSSYSYQSSENYASTAFFLLCLSLLNWFVYISSSLLYDIEAVSNTTILPFVLFTWASLVSSIPQFHQKITRI